VTFSWKPETYKYFLALILASLVSESLFVYSAWSTHSLLFDYLTWNLILAWIPLLVAARLTKALRNKLWSSWEALSLSIIWLIFLPNSFYMITDFIHLQDVNSSNVVYDSTMLSSFIFTGVILGFSSLFLIHLQFRKRFSDRLSAGLIASTLFISSIAMYFGRDLRWTSWDVLINPGGLLFDISVRLQHIASYPNMIIVILAFFVLLCSMYNLMWKGLSLFQAKLRQVNSIEVN
jgi:uncharacterized membrane protein